MDIRSGAGGVAADGFNHALENRRLFVLGMARRVRINLVSDGRPSGKYCYQTHVRVDSPSPIHFAD